MFTFTETKFENGFYSKLQIIVKGDQNTAADRVSTAPERLRSETTLNLKTLKESLPPGEEGSGSCFVPQLICEIVVEGIRI